MANFEFVRNFAMSLPNVSERMCYKMPAFYNGRTLFVRFLADGDSVVVKIDECDRKRRMAVNPKAFSVTDHYINYPMMVIQLSAVDDDDLRDLLSEAWKHAAN